MTQPANAKKISGTGKLFRQGKEISTVLYTLAYKLEHSQKISSGLLKVIRGRTDLLGCGPLTLFLGDGKQVNFRITTGNLRSFEFMMDMEM